MIRLSQFGEKYTQGSGIGTLMDDLGAALADNPDMISMGGGNPGRIQAVEAVYRAHLVGLLSSDDGFHELVGRYQSPQGDEALRKTLADFLRAEYGWDLGPANIAVTNGGQSAFYVLANMLAGRHADGRLYRIQLPMAPEYLGYTDSGLEADFFRSNRPEIETLDDHLFKYRVDFDALQIADTTAALCVSRPTNPTGNVHTDEEIEQLDRLARQHGVPLIIDGAYGTPFPDIIFTEARPHWNDNTILMLSLSKLGLPGLRSGFLVAGEETIRAFSSANAILNLASGNIGPHLLRELLRDGELRRLCRQHIMPWYRDRALQVVDWFRTALGDLPYYIHRPEGAIFLWLWFPGLPVDARVLYERLKRKGVLVIPGNDCFPGLEQGWRHAHECIRISYAQEPDRVKAGVEIIAREIAELHGN